MQRQLLNALGYLGLLVATGAGSMMAQNIAATSPTTVPAGNPTFTLTVNGSGLINVNRFSWRSPASDTATLLIVDAGGTDSQFTVSIPVDLVTTAGNVAIAACVASASLVCGPAGTFPIGIQLTSLAPNSTLAGSGQPFNTVVNAVGGLASRGQYFWNGTTPLSLTTAPSAGSAPIQIPAALINSVGSGTITAVVNGQTSNGLVFSALGPITTSILPMAATAGSVAIPLTINGSNFGTLSFGTPQVRWTFGTVTTNLTPTSSNGSVMNVTIPANLLATAGTATVTVQNFASNSGPISNGQTFTIYALPVVTSVFPTSIPFNTAMPITVTGTFNAGDQIVFNGTTLLTTGNATQLQSTVPANLLTMLGPATVRAVNPAGTQSTTSAALSVVPVISSLNPPNVTAGSGAFPLTVTVTGGLPSGVTLSFNGSTFGVSPSSSTQATATIPANLIQTAGTVAVTIAANGATSAPVNFTIGASTPPTVSQVSPNLATAGDAATSVSITGTNFQQDGQARTGSRVVFTAPGGSPVQLTPLSTTGTVLVVTIPQAQLATAGVATLAATNVTDGTTSGSLAFTIRPRAVITSLSPNPLSAGGTSALNVFGSNFTTTDTILIGAPGCVTLQCLQTLNTTFNNPSNLSASLQGTSIPTQGIYNIYVQNSLGALSQSSPLTVGLTILSLNPSTVAQNVMPLPTLVVQAVGGLTPASVILFNGQPLTTIFDNATQVHATLTGTNVATAGAFAITVQTASLPPSNALNFTVVASAPGLLSVTPNVATAGDGSTVVLISGSNFKLDSTSYVGARVLFTAAGSSTAVQLTPASNSGSVLSVTIPQAQLAQAGTSSIAVTNVTDGFTSGTLPFTIRPRLTLSSLFPNPTAAGITVALLVQGSNFSNGDTLLIGAPGCTSATCLQPLNTTFNSSTSLSASLQGSLIPTQGSYNVYAQNSSGALSQALPLTVTLAITGLSPATVTQNVTPPPTLVVTSPGGFLPGAIIVLSNQALVTVYDSPTQVHAALSAANVTVAGVYPVAVQNPNSIPSITLPFTVQPRGQLSSVNPTSAFAGSGQITLQVSGNNFQQTDVVQLGGSSLATTYLNPQSLTAIIPAALLTNATSYAVTVLNQLGQSSNGLNFQVTLQITGLSPASVTAGGSAFNLTTTLTGGVTLNTVLNYAGTPLSTVSFTPVSITATVPANLFTAAATPPVFAIDGTNQSNTVNHLVLGPLTLISFSPTFVDAGANGLAVTLIGMGFDTKTFVTANGVAIPTTFVSGTNLTAQVPASMLTTAQTLQVGVTDSLNRTSNTLPLAVLTPLSLTSLSPAVVPQGSPDVTITVNGAGFDTSTSVLFTAGSRSGFLATTYVSPTQVVAVIPAPFLVDQGIATIKAADLSRTPIRFSTNSLLVTIGRPAIITNLNPSSALINTTISMIITGSGFNPTLPPDSVTTANPQVLFGTTLLPATLVSDTQINVTIPSTVNSIAGIIPVSVKLTDGRTSNTLPFNVFSAPVIISISPSAVDLRTSGLTLTVTGLYFQSGAVIVLNGSPLSTTFVSSTVLTAPLPPFATSGAATVVVVNPGGLSSNTLGLGIGGAKPVPPTLSTLLPQTVTPGGPGFTLTASGSGFQSGAVINFGGAVLVTTFVNSGQLTGAVPANLVAQTANVTVYVSNPDGGATNSLIFVISGKPVISSLNPPSISAGAASFTLGVSGTGFKSGASISFGGASLPTTFISANQLTGAVPASLVKTAGQIPVIVTNPDGGTSDPVNFAVNPFSLNSISPAAANTGGPGFTMTLTGVGFLSGASASFNGSGITTAFVNSTTLTASIPANLIVVAGTAAVTVTNPDGAVGGPLVFTIRSGVTLISISPTTIPANSKATSITATGTGFVQGAAIIFNGNPIVTTFGSASSVSGTLPPELLTQTGAFSVAVMNPNGDATNALNFTVSTALPLPMITDVSQTTAVAGSAALTITVNGSGFVQGSTVVFGGTNSATTFVSATQLKAVVSAGQLTQGGLFTIIVTNPNGDQSNAVSFTVVTPLSIISLSPTALSVVAGNSPLVIAGSGIVGGATVQFGSTSLTPDTSSPTQVSVTIPGSLLTQPGTVNVTVKNPDGTVSNALTFTIVPLPAISISAVIAPAGTNQVTLTLDNPAPTDLLGTLVLSFTASSANTPANYVDPALQFASGGTSISFTIPKGAKTATLPGNGVFSPGTVAGTLTLTLTRLIAGIDNVLPTPPPSKSFTIAAAAPTITPNTVKIINATSAGFTVEVIGFTTTRDIKTVGLTFASSQSIDGGGTFTVDVSAAFNAYFTSALGLANGGTFKLDIPFTISGADANVITAVSVTLTNSAGTSQSVSGGR